MAHACTRPPRPQRLATKEWTSRVSACRLFATAYPRVAEPLRSELRAMFVQVRWAGAAAAPPRRWGVGLLLLSTCWAFGCRRLPRVLAARALQLCKDETPMVRRAAAQVGREPSAEVSTAVGPRAGRQRSAAAWRGWHGAGVGKRQEQGAWGGAAIAAQGVNQGCTGRAA